MSVWVSVEDKLPDNNSDVLICYNYGDNMDPDYAIGYYNKSRWEPSTAMIEARNYDGGACIYLDEKPTHWMPLPKPPL